jgi:CubicO group peptidase (beta-lactamase class C family)
MNADRTENWELLSEVVTTVMQTKDVPGVAVGILHQGKIASSGFGVTHVEHSLPVTDETLFQVGSITKTFTATALMQLVEAGKLELDATAQSYLPAFRVVDEEASTGATLRHLLTHTGGWVGDFFRSTGMGADALSKYVAEMAGLEQLAPVGTIWSYCNSGFSVAGRILEVVTEKPYEAALQELLLEPIGLSNTYFDPGDVIPHRFAVGHDVTPNGPQVALPWPLPRFAYPAGGIVTHVRDLLRYAQFCLDDGRTEDGTRLLAPETMAQMQAAHTIVWGKETWGLGWSVDKTYGTPLISHGGGTRGQVSLLLLAPEHDFAIAILTNADRGGVVTREVSRWALQHYLSLEVTDPEPIETSPEELAQYVGRYARPFAEMELGILGGRLIAQMTYKQGFPDEGAPPPPPPPPMTLAPCAPDRLIVLDGALKDNRVEVVRNPDGSIGWLRAGRLNRRVEV